MLPLCPHEARNGTECLRASSLSASALAHHRCGIRYRLENLVQPKPETIRLEPAPALAQSDRSFWWPPEPSLPAGSDNTGAQTPPALARRTSGIACTSARHRKQTERIDSPSSVRCTTASLRANSSRPNHCRLAGRCIEVPAGLHSSRSRSDKPHNRMPRSA